VCVCERERVCVCVCGVFEHVCDACVKEYVREIEIVRMNANQTKIFAVRRHTHTHAYLVFHEDSAVRVTLAHLGLAL
jgi:hypothetical protein